MLRFARVLLLLGVGLVVIGFFGGFGLMAAADWWSTGPWSLRLLMLTPAGFLLVFLGFTMLVLHEPRSSGSRSYSDDE